MISSGVARIPRSARIWGSASTSGRYPRVGPYCSTDGSDPSSTDCVTSRKSSQANVSGAGNPGAKEMKSGTSAPSAPILRIADSCIVRAARENEMP
jgi:hypothetical protein